MAGKSYVPLEDRALLALSGDAAAGFLQGLISNDVEKVTAGAVIYAALLTPQGKYLHDFFVLADEDGALLLDCEAERIDDLERRLKIYRLRARVDIERVGERLHVFALIGPGAADTAGPFADGVIYADPRLAALGARAVLPANAASALEAAGLKPAGRAEYDRLRLGLGIPDGSRDLVAEKSLPLENGFDELGGVDFEKGCYIGQEVTTRMKHRALVRKRLLPVSIEGPPPEPGAKLMRGDVEVGEMRSSRDGNGLAMVRLEHFEAALRDGAALVSGDARHTARRPDWALF